MGGSFRWRPGLERDDLRHGRPLGRPRECLAPQQDGA